MARKTRKDAAKGNDYIVYFAKHDGRIVYIGSGKPGRHAHVNSGHSHNPNVNRHFFTIGVMDVEVVHDGMSKEAASWKEIDLIDLHQPEYNIKKKAVVKDVVPMRFRKWPYAPRKRDDLVESVNFDIELEEVWQLHTTTG